MRTRDCFGRHEDPRARHRGKLIQQTPSCLRERTCDSPVEMQSGLARQKPPRAHPNSSTLYTSLTLLIDTVAPLPAGI